MTDISESIEIKASPKKCYEVITDFESYPEFLKENDNVIVESHKGNSWTVSFYLTIIKTFSYTLKLKGEPHKKLEWEFIKGDFIKSNTGRWIFEEVKKGVTKATYELEIKLGMLVPGTVAKMLIGSNLPTMLKAFKNRIESK